MNIKLEHVSYIYSPDTAYAREALKDITLELDDGEFAALAGSTGSGKSTLVQILNGLKQPTTGKVFYDGQEIGKDKKALQNLRCRIGLVFQYPEYQLFDETVLKDVSFGPKNKGLSEEDALRKAEEALQAVGLPEDCYLKSPFDLSGGEKRRAAIAGILAMDPEVLILDEPTAGLDPVGKTQILELVQNYQKQSHGTVLMVSHNMDEVAEYADRIIVMDDGGVIMDGDPHEVFLHTDTLQNIGLEIPQAAAFCQSMDIRGPITLRETADAILETILEH